MESYEKGSSTPPSLLSPPPPLRAHEECAGPPHCGAEAGVIAQTEERKHGRCLPAYVLCAGSRPRAHGEVATSYK